MPRRRKRKTSKTQRPLKKGNGHTSSSAATHDGICPQKQTLEKDAQKSGEKSDDTQHSQRKRLPVTRRSITHKFTVGEQEGYMTVGLFEDGRPGELFLTIAKEGSTIGGLMDAIGILTSLALQYGVPVETLTRKLEYTRFEPSGWTHNENIRQASSVVDYIFRWLGIQFSETYLQEHLASHEPETSSEITIHDNNAPED